MSNRYKGAVISATPPTTSGGESGTASGVWTLEQQLQLIAASLWPIQPLPKYIEDVFSTYLYTGNGTSQTITNGINISGNGGLVWIKPRSLADNHSLFDTARGALNRLRSNDTTANVVQAHGVSAFNTTGFSITGANGETNQNTITYASWTFREQTKFFDVVTWTGTGVARTIAHNLGSTPGCIIVKRTDTAANWEVFHRAIQSTPASSADYSIQLNLTNAAAISSVWNSGTPPTSSVFSVGSGATVNASGGTYVAYVFAHDAGGFGLTGTDNVISCGSFTTNASGEATVNLGYEPQWVMYKPSSLANSWNIIDTMRGYTVGGTYDPFLRANSVDAEYTSADLGYPTATGFYATVDGSATCIYIAIRRGPMAVPTLGTSVFQPYNAADTTTQTVGFPTDMYFDFNKTGAPYNVLVGNRLVGTTAQLFTQSTAAESNTYGPSGSFASNTTFAPSMIGAGTAWYSFRRTPGFFDVVCYTGTGSNATITHNLTVAPEMVIIKSRSTAYAWPTLVTAIGDYKFLFLDTNGAQNTASSYFNNTYPTASVFSVGTNVQVNGSGATFVAYLFATCAGVSKVGSYTGNGTTQTINCGFGAGGARFVLIKRYDDGSTGDWYVYDTARGMTVLTDPYIRLNVNSAEVATLGSVTTVSTGFALDSAILAAINVSAGTYIFLAIA